MATQKITPFLWFDNQAEEAMNTLNLNVMVEVFKTNVQKVSQSKKLIALLIKNFPGSKINFDLQDCDKILRVEGEGFLLEKVILLVKENGFTCKVLE